METSLVAFDPSECGKGAGGWGGGLFGMRIRYFLASWMDKHLAPTV